MFETKKELLNYIRALRAATGREWVGVEIPAGSDAFSMGYRYAAIEPDEIEEYQALGATLV